MVIKIIKDKFRSSVEFLLTSAKIFKISFLWAHNHHHLWLIIPIFTLLEHAWRYAKLFYKPWVEGNDTFYGLIDHLCGTNCAKFQVLLFSTVLEWSETIHQKSRHCCLYAVNKNAILQGLMTKYLASFEFKFQKTANFRLILAHFLLMSAEKLIYFTFFYMELLINYVGVIVPSFKLFDLVELVLWLFIENTSKFNWVPGPQTLWPVKLTFLRKSRIANITFLEPQMY